MHTISQLIPTAHHRASGNAITNFLSRTGVSISAIVIATVVAAIVLLMPEATEALQYDRGDVASGRWWQLMTCHLTHWSWDHLFWDASVFLVLGCFCVSLRPARAILCLVVSTIVVALSVHVLCGDYATYRGLSGVDSALFAFAASVLVRDSWERRDWSIVAIIAALMCGFLAKTGWEVVTASTFFVDSQIAGFLPVPEAHLAGAAVGLLMGSWRRSGSGRDNLQSLPYNRTELDHPTTRAGAKAMDIQAADQLVAKKCQPCEGGVDPCTLEEATSQLAKLDGWELARDGQRIRKNWTVKNFMAAMAFFNKVAEVAEDDGHHPDIHLEGYRNVWIELWTHAIGGLSENDFILAAKIDQLPIDVKS